MKKLTQLGCVMVIALVISGACIANKVDNRGVIHTVLLWLKQPGDDTHRQQLIRASDRLRTIPGVLDIRFGEMITSERAIVDDSFDVADVEAMNRYLVDPVHEAVVANEIKPLVNRILVYDFYDTLPE